MAAGALGTVPLAGEPTSSLISRIADRYDRYGLTVCCGSGRAATPPHGRTSGGVRADAEIVLNEAGRDRPFGRRGAGGAGPVAASVSA